MWYLTIIPCDVLKTVEQRHAYLAEISLNEFEETQRVRVSMITELF